MKFKNFIKKNYSFFLIVGILTVFFYLKLPYYIMAPGGAINITDRVELEGYNSGNGSINMLYVSEYRATPSLLVYSFLMGYDVNKNDERKISNESIEEVENRSKIMRDNSLDVALIVAYNKAGKYIDVGSKKNIVLATTKDNGFMVGDIVLKADNNEVNDIDDIKEIINTKEENDYVVFDVIRDNKEIKVKSRVYLEEEQKIIGVVIITDYDYEMDPKIDLKFRDSESGSSGGLMLTLTIYNALVDEDIIKGRNIAGTGTISYDGKVGEIDGIKYKIMGAAEAGMDIVFVPSANYDEAISTKEKYHYDMDIVKVDTFDDALNYLTK